VILARLVRLSRVLWNALSARRAVPSSARRLVSANRRRFQRDGFDLDITYIQRRIMAMSVPAVRLEALYRNPVRDVARFFRHYHATRYRIYNLCPERRYPYAAFDRGAVQERFMADHNPAPLRQLLRTCAHIAHWLAAHAENVVAIQCKGGKGRTGTQLCSALLYLGTCKSAADALALFAEARTADDGDTEGVEARSQTRYIQYMERICYDNDREMPPSRAVRLDTIRIKGFQEEEEEEEEEEASSSAASPCACASTARTRPWNSARCSISVCSRTLNTDSRMRSVSEVSSATHVRVTSSSDSLVHSRLTR
jgi:PTEN phosphatase family protein